MLENKIAIYIPSTINVSEQADNSIIEIVNKRVINYMIMNYGGCSQYPLNGYWKTEKGDIVKDDILYTFSNCISLSDKDLEKAKKICSWICRTLSQECISLEINGCLMFIDRNGKEC